MTVPVSDGGEQLQTCRRTEFAADCTGVVPQSFVILLKQDGKSNTHFHAGPDAQAQQACTLIMSMSESLQAAQKKLDNQQQQIGALTASSSAADTKLQSAGMKIKALTAELAAANLKFSQLQEENVEQKAHIKKLKHGLVKLHDKLDAAVAREAERVGAEDTGSLEEKLVTASTALLRTIAINCKKVCG